MLSFCYQKFVCAFNTVLISILCTSLVVAESVPEPDLSSSLRVTSWKALRDYRVVKQEYDYSCGAASLATILNEFYGMSVTEKDILTQMKAKDRTSFQQISDVAPFYGVNASGLMLSFDDLKQLRVPVIAYVKYRDEDHFTVIRGIRRDGVVHVADSSWGNRQLTAYQFRQMWELTDGKGTIKRGRILLVVPQNINKANIDRKFFSHPQGWPLLLQTVPLSPSP